MPSAIGGGPLLVADGRPVFDAKESFAATTLNQRNARSAIGQLSDGRLLLVSVEGGSPAYSVGMTNYELGVALARLGARTAMGLGTGGIGLALLRRDAPQPPLARRRAAARRRARPLVHGRLRGAALGRDPLAERRRRRRHRDVRLQARPPVARRRHAHRPRRRRAHARRRRRAAGRAHARLGRPQRRRLAGGGGNLALRRHRDGRSRPHHDGRAGRLPRTTRSGRSPSPRPPRISHRRRRASSRRRSSSSTQRASSSRSSRTRPAR